MKTASMKDLHDKLGKIGKDELILDVRRPDEFAEGHVPGARNISHDEIEAHAGELKKFKTVYMHCRSGGRVMMAGQALASHGLENLVLVISGGFPDWVEAGFPVEK